MSVINEHFLTPISEEERNKYKEEVYKILVESYKDIGGLFGIDSADDLVKQTHIWKLVRKGGKIVAAIVYADKIKNGERKAIAAGTNGTEEGKKALYSIIKEDLKFKNRHAIVEVSGKMEHIYKKFGGVPIPNTLVQDILGPSKKIIDLNLDGYHYTRAIGPDKIIKEKCMFGFPVEKK